MLRIAMAVATLGLMLCGPAAGQTSAPGASAQSSSSEATVRMTAARELVSVMRVQDTMRGILPVIWQQMISPLIARNDPRVRSAVDSLAPILMAEMEAEAPAFSMLIAQVYADAFSEDELKGLAAFMRTPIGQKFIAKQSETAQASMTAGQKFGENLFRRMGPRIEEELNKRLGR